MRLCLKFVQYSILVNGDANGQIIPRRRLGQRDPLSPYLFILCIEGLSSLIKHSEGKGEIHGVKVCRGAPTLTHLLFVDECLLF